MPRRIVTISIDEGLLAQVDGLRGGGLPRPRGELMRELTWCQRCGAVFARAIRRVDRVRGELVSVQGMPWTILRPGSRAARSGSRPLGDVLRQSGVLGPDGKLPSTFEALEARRLEARERDEVAALR